MMQPPPPGCVVRISSNLGCCMLSIASDRVYGLPESNITSFASCAHIAVGTRLFLWLSSAHLLTHSWPVSTCGLLSSHRHSRSGVPPQKTTVANFLLLRRMVRPYPSASVLSPQVMTFRGPLSSNHAFNCVSPLPKHAIRRRCCLRGSPVTPDCTPRDLRMSPLHRPKSCILLMTRFAVQTVLFKVSLQRVNASQHCHPAPLDGFLRQV